MKCPECGAAELGRDTRDHTYSYKGQTTTIAAVTADYCPACNESLTMLEESDRVIAAMRALAKQINSSLVDPV